MSKDRTAIKLVALPSTVSDSSGTNDKFINRWNLVTKTL